MSSVSKLASSNLVSIINRQMDCMPENPQYRVFMTKYYATPDNYHGIRIYSGLEVLNFKICLS